MGETVQEQKGSVGPQLREDLLRTLAANAPVGVYLTDVNGRCRYANQKWCEMAGMALEEALGDGWVSAIHPEDRERVRTGWYRLSAIEWGWQQEFRFQTPDGKVTWIASYATKVRDEQGSILGYIGININISSAKNLEKALRESEERYRTTIDAMSDGIHVVDNKLTITLNNSTIARWAQEMGLSGIMVGKTPFKVFPFLPERVADEYRHVFQTGEVLVTEEVTRFAHKVLHTETRKIPIFTNRNVSQVATVIRDISQRAQAEQALRESEERYRLLFQNMAQGVFYQQADGKIIDANSAALEVLGLTRKQFLGRTSYHPAWKVILPNGAILTPEQHPSMVALQTGKIVENFELGVYRPNTKDYAWLVVNAIPQFREDEEKPYQVFVTLHDITERKHAETELEKSEERFRLLYERSPLGYQSLDENGNVIEVNPAWVQLLGYERQEALGHWFGDFIVPEMVDSFRARFPQFKEIGETRSEFEMKRKDGETLTIEFVGKIGYDNEGNFRQTHCVLHNVTEKKKAEQALRESEEHLRLALEGAVADSWEMDLKSGLLTFSDRWAAHMGYRPGEVDQSMAAVQKIVHPDDLERTFIDLNAYLEGETTLYETECRLQRKNGEYVWVISRGKAIAWDELGKPVRLIGTNFDVSKQKQNEALLERQAQEMKALQDTVLEIIAPHELSTLLPTIVERAVHLLGGSEGGLYLTDPDKKEVHCVVSYNNKRDYTGTVLKYGEGAAGTVAQNGQALIIDDYRTWSGRASIFESDQPFISLVSVPLMWDGQVIGVLHVLNDEGKAFSQTDRELLSMFAAHATMAIGKAEALEQAQNEITERKRTEDILETRLRISKYAAHHTQDELLQLTLDEAERLTGSSIGFLHFVEDDQINLHLQTWSTNTLKTMCTLDGKGQHYSVYQAGVWVDCLLEKKPVIHNDYQSLPHKKGYPAGHAPVTRELTVPVIVGDKIKAIIGVGNKETEYDENDINAVSTLAHMVWDIAKRKQAEDALHESQKNLQATFDANTDSALLIEKDGQIVTCNDTVARVFDSTKIRLIGKNAYDLVDKSVAEHRQKFAEQVITSGEAVRFVDERNGRTIDNSVYPVFDESGQVVRLAIYGKDVTEQKLAEAALKENEEQLRMVIENSQDGINVLDLHTWKYIFMSPAQVEMTGFTTEEINNISAEEAYDRVHPDDRAISVEQQQQTVAGLDPTPVEYRWKVKSGEYRWFSDSRKLVRDSQGNPVAMVGVSRDITKRKQAEEKIRESEERYRLLAENSNDVIALFDGEYKPLYISPSSVRMTGYRIEDFDTLDTFDLIHPDDRAGVLESIEQGEQQQSLRKEFRISKKDGTYIWVETLDTRSFDEASKTTYHLLNIRDITERKLVEEEKERLLLEITQQREELRTLNARVTEADETERRRIATDLHDQIGQNLSALSINMNIIQSQIHEDAIEIRKRIGESLQLVDETTDEIRRVMEDLHPTVLDDYGLRPALEWLAERVTRSTNLRVEVVKKGLKKTRLDHKIEVNLFRITQEALNNAARHAEAKQVKVELKQLKQVLQLSIVDNGSGFDLSAQHDSDDRKWGLRIMRERAESIGGRFRVESEAGKGTKVVVELGS